MLINPISFRLSTSIFWNSTWSTYKNYNYKYLFYSDLVFFEFFMFFFKKTLSLKFLDFYPSHIRLYRLNDKIIVNLYYHIAKEEYYFDEIDVIYKKLHKKMLLKKKKNLINKKNVYIFQKKKILKIVKYFFFKLFLNNLNLKKNVLNLKKNLLLLWKKIKKKFDLESWNLIKKIIKKYFLYLKKKYIYIYIKYSYILKNIYKKKKNIKKKKIYVKILKRKNLLIKKISKEIIKLNDYEKKTLINKKKRNLFLKKNKKNKKKLLFISLKNKNKLDALLFKIKKKFLRMNIYIKFKKIKKNTLFINWKKKKIKKKIMNNNLFYLYKINFLKFIFNQKLWIFNFFFYFLSKFFKKINKFFFIFLKNLELNIFKININSVTSNVISKYITSSFKNNYSIYETLRPVLVDLKERMRKKKVAGFKITVTGRFKRAERATYWWRKDGNLLTGTQLAAVDYSTSLHKTKYGVCSINIWLTLGIRGLNQLIQEYPTFYPFFFLLKKKKINYFIIKKNSLFFNNFLLKGKIETYNLKYNYIKGFIIFLISKYLYINIFLKNILIKNKKKISKYLKKIFLPQYCKYKIYLEDYFKKDVVKIVPFIQLKYLKRINLRNSYKISFLNKSKLINIKIFKYKIFLY